jgi:predicted MPP superfamily phosphohydrolase
VAQTSRGKFDLQLSGHVHKGQIFPFNILTWLAYPIRTGLTDLGSGSRIYVSRGTGVWGPPIRFLAPPEVAVFDLISEQKSAR